MLSKLLFGLGAAWAWFWYNSVTRIFFVLLPTYMIAVIPFFKYVLEVPADDMANSIAALYFFIFMIAVYDNDFSKRKKYGIPDRLFFNKKSKP